MRIVTKTNLALVGVVAMSAVLNFGILQWTIMPLFLDIESDTASRNQSRAIQAIQGQEGQVAASARDYAFWDDSYSFIKGELPAYEAQNVSPESLKALGVNFFVAIDAAGNVRLDKGFDYSAEEPRQIQALPLALLPEAHPLRLDSDAPQSRQGLMQTSLGLVAFGYAPILTSNRAGPPLGTLGFGKLLDIDALREVTQVDFELLPPPSDGATPQAIARNDDTIETRTVLDGIDGKPIAMLVSRTERLVSSAGRQAIWIAMSLLVVGGALLIATLAALLRHIVITRVEALRRHLASIASTGSLVPIPSDHRGDELSDTVASFNQMALQLEELREALRRQDYNHGAADQAAGILHNVRNAVSPISTITWDLLRSEDAPWKQNVAKAVEQLADADLAPDRGDKLRQFVVLSAGRLVEESAQRRSDLEQLSSMVRHVDGILKDQDAASQGERVLETIDVARCAATASAMIHGHSGVTLTVDIPSDARVMGHKIAFEQTLANLLLNAVEAIRANGADGSILVAVAELQHNGSPALDIRIRDTGDGIPADRLETIFEKGFSTRRERSSGLGLHWCANAVNAMKGRLYAESEGAGRGATLHLVLPQAAVDLKEAA